MTYKAPFFLYNLDYNNLVYINEKLHFINRYRHDERLELTFGLTTSLMKKHSEGINS